MIEQRVVFKLDLPNKKVISVKSKTCKILSEVLRPILHKYSYRLDLVQAFSRESPDPLEMSLPVTAVDGQRLQIVCKEELVGEVASINTSNGSKQKISPQNFKLGNVPVTFVRANKLTTSASNPQLNTLDEITNKVFNELLQGKVEGHEAISGVNGNHKPLDQGSVKVRLNSH
jgi:regulator of G-protein signaling